MGRATALSVALGIAIAGCGDAERRPQLVVTTTTDLALPGQIEADPALSAAASIDRVRVEILGPDGATRESRDFVVRDRVNFPLTFGVAEANAGERIDVRVTGFRSHWANNTNGASPSLGVSVQRLVRTSITGIQKVDVVLRGDCIGRPADASAGTTCIDAARLSAPATDSDARGDVAPGQWDAARPRPCTGAARQDTICIPGGASAVGDPALVDVDRASDVIPAPPRMVLLAPYFLDRDEITVADLRAVAATVPKLPALQSSDARCNYTTSAGANDREAVRCVPFETARAFCRARGADLPTAAQWEHAARGRGRGSRYPWGDIAPTCCTAGLAGGTLGCRPKTAVGSYTDPSKCADTADVSIDGVVDLGGSVREWVLDSPVSFDGCIAEGIASDPMCNDASAGAGSTKGGSLSTPLEGATASMRRTGASIIDVGFRCAWADR